MERPDDTERYGKGESRRCRLRREEDDLDSFPTVRGNRRAGLTGDRRFSSAAPRAVRRSPSTSKLPSNLASSCTNGLASFPSPTTLVPCQSLRIRHRKALVYGLSISFEPFLHDLSHLLLASIASPLSISRFLLALTEIDSGDIYKLGGDPVCLRDCIGLGDIHY